MHPCKGHSVGQVVLGRESHGGMIREPWGERGPQQVQAEASELACQGEDPRGMLVPVAAGPALTVHLRVQAPLAAGRVLGHFPGVEAHARVLRHLGRRGRACTVLKRPADDS